MNISKAALSGALLVAVLCAATEGRATPASYIYAYGSASTKATNGVSYGSTFTSQYQDFGSAYDRDYVPSGFSGRADAASRGTALPYPQSPSDGRQAADATAAGSVSYGALHGAAIGDTSIGEQYVYNTVAQAGFGAVWYDTLVFHTTNAAGVDFHYSLTLADGLSTTIAPNALGNYTSNSTLAVIEAAASAALNVLPPDGNNRNYHIGDEFLQYGAATSTTPGPLVQNLAPARTVGGTLHVDDGDVVGFQQFFGVSIYVGNVNGLASAIANDTAYFNLFSNDPDAWYTAASGTLYATSGDPDLGPIVTPPPGGTVPEPSIVALMLAGLGASVVERRRVPKADR